MNREENIKAILDTCFSESKDEIKEVALNNIMSLSADTVIREDTVTLNSPITISAVQGEWIEVEDDYDNVYWECSNCKDAFFLEVGTPKDNNYNFCPNCGADMRGEEE